jgi:hypothetical protein
MKYNVTLKATVEAESAEAAEQMVFDKAAESAGEVKIEAVPTKKWAVDVEITATLTFPVAVNAESAEDAKCKAYELVENEAYCGDGIPGVLDLADWSVYDLGALDINTYDAVPVEDEEGEEDAQPDTATAV